MAKKNILLYLIFLILSGNLFAQIDSVSFQFVPDASIYKARVHAQKVTYSSTDTILTNFTLEDTVGSAYTFDWGGDIEPNLDGLPTALYEFADTGIYTFSLSVTEASSGNTYTATKIRRLKGIRVPNVFTPNNDGLNDLFMVFYDGTAELEITIFSRTGTKVFGEKSRSIVWDGRNSSGAEVSEGLYYYILTCESPLIDQKGYFYLYRQIK